MTEPATTSRTPGSGPSLVERVAPVALRCRCGRRIAPGEPVLVLIGLSEVVEPFFQGRSFCSGQCARAEFLETFETMDGLVGSPAGAMVSDLRLVYGELGRAFAAIIT